jgi:phage protein D
MSAGYTKRSDNQSEAAVCNLLINGQKADYKLLPFVTGISVDLSLDKTGMLTLEMESYDKEKGETDWMDNDLLDVGKEVEVKMGYGNKLKSLFFGDIMGINASFSSAGSPTLTVRAYDRRHRLEKHTESRHFEKKKYSDIARDIAGYWKLKSQVDDSLVVHEYVEKSNQNDLEFLEKLAKEINYRVIIVGKDLLFERARNDTSEIMTLTLEKDLTDFSADLSLVAQASEVVVRGWDPAEKKELVSRANAGSEGSKMGGKQSASQLSRKLFGDSVAVVSSHPVRTQAEADQLAKARLDRIALGLVEANGSVMGSADLLPGKVIKIEGASNRFSGRYYVTRVIHRYDQQNGFSTRFTARRNAL